MRDPFEDDFLAERIAEEIDKRERQRYKEQNEISDEARILAGCLCIPLILILIGIVWYSTHCVGY